MNPIPTTKNARSAWIPIEIGLFLLLLLYAIYAVDLRSYASFINDEGWGHVHSLMNPIESIWFTLRFDLHPPGYYLNLVTWSLLGDSDFWLRMNSAFWVISSLVLICFYYRRLNDPRERLLSSLLAILILLSNPLIDHYLTELRMYTFLVFLCTASLLLTRGYLDRRGPGRFAAIFFVSLIAIYTHTGGFLIVLCQGMYGLLHGLETRDRKFLIRWILAHASLMMLSLPVIALASIKSVSHTLAPGLSDVIGTLRDLFVVEQTAIPALATICAILAIVILLHACLRSIEARRLLIAYLVVPFLFSICVSYLFKPFWISRLFILFVPVFAIIVIDTLHGLRERRSEWRLLLGIVFLFAALNLHGVVENMFSRQATQAIDYRQSGKMIAHETAAGDCIIVRDGLSGFWNSARYLAGPQWGHPLLVQPPLNERWQKFSARVPHKVAEYIHLIPPAQHLDWAGRLLFAGMPSDLTRCKKAVWYLVRDTRSSEFLTEIGAPTVLLRAEAGGMSFYLKR